MKQGKKIALITLATLLFCFNNYNNKKSNSENLNENPKDRIPNVTTVSKQIDTNNLVIPKENLPNNNQSISLDNSDSLKDSYFYIEFLDVGQADSIFIACDNHYALIDGGNTDDSDLIYSFLKNNEYTHLDFVLNTHPDEDHVGGLAGALNYATIDHAYAPVNEWDTRAFNNYLKYVNKQNKKIEIPLEGQILELGNAKLEVLALNTGLNSNERSIILMVNYGSTKMLLTGDAESVVEDYLINNKDISCNLLKVAHHGSGYSTSYLFLRESNPDICVIQVGKHNSYGHPSELVLSKIEDLGATVYRTDVNGDIKCVSDGEKLCCSVEKNESLEDDLSVKVQSNYVLNTNSKKIHYPECSSVGKMKEKNKLYTDKNIDELLAEGYSPCGNCKP